MEASYIGNPRAAGRSLWPAIALYAIGYALTLYVFFPGVMTYDGRFIYEDTARPFRGDWQSPVLTNLWGLIDPIAPGSGSIFLLVATLYWVAFGVMAVSMGRRSFWPALLLAFCALSPPAFVFVGVVWRDVPFAVLWLLAGTLGFAAPGWMGRIIALGLLAFGVLLRPNALFAAPILVAYLWRPGDFSLKRALIVYLPSVLLLYGLWQGIYYGAIGAVRQHPEQSVMVYDLGGITHFAKENQFPVSWSEEETALLIGGCYQPTEWNVYWSYGPCRFVMERLERNGIFGTDVLAAAWRRSIIAYPAAYFRHRASYMSNFLAGDENVTVWLRELDDPSKFLFADRMVFTALRSMHDALKPTLLFRPWLWLLASTVLCAVAWRRRGARAGAFALGLCGSAVIYVASFFVFGVSSDFRYAYWAVLATLAGAVALTLPDRTIRFTQSG